MMRTLVPESAADFRVRHERAMAADFNTQKITDRAEVLDLLRRREKWDLGEVVDEILSEFPGTDPAAIEALLLRVAYGINYLGAVEIREVVAARGHSRGC